MADPASPSGATPEAGAMPAGVAEAVPPPEGGDETDLGDAGKRALAQVRRELRTITSERDELSRAARERADAEKSEIEKVTAARDEATGRVQSLELQVLKMDAAIEAGIPAHWKRLDGSNADELLADAKEFAKQLTTTEGEDGATPADLGAGPRPGTPATGRDGFNAAIRARARR